ncbi:FAD-dependent monooxygenase, partial [Escherichia coli]|uniref:FAD-dependent monooxygenase n=3 Tax=Pseudomonadota TaxID=1224 RepID=UPI00285F0BEA
LDVTLLNRSIWRVSMQVAETFRKGRVFLVGDCAHRFPPTGGFGLNSGVQDAHNLAWKLAFVLKGMADEKLLDSYSSERRPIAQSNANFSYGNRLRFGLTDDAVRSRNPDRIKFWINDMDNHLHSIGQNLGHNYEE